MYQLGLALDQISYEWLAEAHPDLAEAIESEVSQGATPERIKHFVLRHTQRLELALRCEQAARHMARLNDSGPAQQEASPHTRGHIDTDLFTR